MDYWWHQFECFFWFGSTFQGAALMIGMGAVAGLIIGALLVAIAGVRAFVQGFKTGLAKDRAKRMAKEGRPDASTPEPPFGDISPGSDL